MRRILPGRKAQWEGHSRQRDRSMRRRVEAFIRWREHRAEAKIRTNRQTGRGIWNLFFQAGVSPAPPMSQTQPYPSDLERYSHRPGSSWLVKLGCESAGGGEDNPYPSSPGVEEDYQEFKV